MTAFWMTWKPDGWPIERLRDLIQRASTDSNTTEHWRIQAHRQAVVGSRAYLFKQGTGPRGIFGVGTTAGPPIPIPDQSHDPENPQWFVPLRFEQLTDPTSGMLLSLDQLEDIVPVSRIKANASGTTITDDVAAKLDDRLGMSSPSPTLSKLKVTAGSDWSPDEVNACVSAYFDMLDLELAGKPFSKADFNRQVQTVTHRTKGSVEFKFGNVSAVMDQLGLRWIQGYKPAPNAQAGAIKDAIEHQLASRSSLAARLRSFKTPDVPPGPSLADLTDRSAVLQAIREFDTLGRDAFLANYGYGEAREIFLLHDGERYDSKAIVGAAFAYQPGVMRPLTNGEFSGGAATVQRALERLGFEVEVSGGRSGMGVKVNSKAVEPSDADEQPFDPKSAKDARQAVLRSIKARRGQRGFRDALITVYESRCAITGCDVLDVLEAAHITPYLGPETNHVTNGLLLRADLHTLFDTGLLAVNPDNEEVQVAPTVKDPMYRALHGKLLRPTTTKTSAPSAAALKQHWSDCGW